MFLVKVAQNVEISLGRSVPRLMSIYKKLYKNISQTVNAPMKIFCRERECYLGRNASQHNPLGRVKGVSPRPE